MTRAHDDPSARVWMRAQMREGIGLNNRQIYFSTVAVLM